MHDIVGTRFVLSRSLRNPVRGSMRPVASLRAFTIVELLVVISIIALLVGILLPAVGKARDAALTTQSSSNLRNMSTAYAAYAADWGDRQWTACPDDAGLYQGNCNSYLAAACPPQLILGYNDDGAIGYFLGSGGQCSNFGYPGSCGNWPLYWPSTFTPGNVVGSFRLANVKSFNSYLNGRFYDAVFYAPKDTQVLDGAEKYIASPYEFDGEGGTEIYQSSYCLSPAAMWHPDVLGKNLQTGKYWTPPSALPAAWRSPTTSQATYPELKTRMLEHHWLQNRSTGMINPNFSGGTTPWYFNHGYGSAPATLFFDGHVNVAGVSAAIDADVRSLSTGGPPLWSRHTTLQGNGYYIQQSYDFQAETSYHILTTDGIQGRDFLTTN